MGKDKHSLYALKNGLGKEASGSEQLGFALISPERKRTVKMMKKLTIALAVLMIASGSVLAGTIRHDRTESQYLSLGATYSNVGRIIVNTPTADYLGSGTLIAPNWVLTAGHMVDDIISGTVAFGGTSYTAESWVAHSNWDGNLLNGNDIALIKLMNNVVGIDAAELYTGSDEFGQVGTAVGYGKSGTGLTGAVTSAGTLRAGNNVIDAYYGKNQKKTKILLSDFDNPLDPGDNSYGSDVPLNLEYLIAPGDSGGPVFIDIDGVSLLAGVNSFGASFDEDTDSDYGDVSGHTRVSQFTNWIDGILAGGDGGGGKGKGGNGGGNGGGRGGGKPTLSDTDLGPNVDAMIIPEPTSMILLAAGLPLLLKNRRRRK